MTANAAFWSVGCAQFSLNLLHYRTREELLDYRVQHSCSEQITQSLTSDRRCGVMLKFEDASPDLFAKLMTDAPQWTERMA